MYCVYRISGDKKLLIARTRTMERAALLAQKVMAALRLWRSEECQRAAAAACQAWGL